MERKEIPVDRLTLDTVQSRDVSWVGDEEDRRLAKKVRENGLMQDLLVRPLDDTDVSPDGGSDTEYSVIAGGRRLHAAMEAGKEWVPCKIIDTDDIDAAWTSLHENTDRRDLSEGEVAQQLRFIHEMVRPASVPTECPACGCAVEGEDDLLTHTEESACTLPGTPEDGPEDDRFYTEEQALRHLAYQFLGREDDSALELVQGHLRTSKLPPSVRALFKDDQERNPKEKQALENYGIEQETTLGSGEGKSGTSREVVALHETVQQKGDDAINPTDAVLETVGSLNHNEMSEQELRRTLRSFRQDMNEGLDDIESDDDQREIFGKTLDNYREDIVEHYEYVEYKATEYGIDVKQVDPENTSRRCSTCGFTHPDNRESESFECLKCSYENHADYNAAKNIGLRYLRRNQTGDGGGAPLGVRLNSGTLNVNGAYDPPASTEARTGVHAESHDFSRG